MANTDSAEKRNRQALKRRDRNRQHRSSFRTAVKKLRAAVDAVKCVDAFVPSTAPSGIGWNSYYKTEEEFFYAVGEAMRSEYQAILDAAGLRTRGIAQEVVHCGGNLGDRDEGAFRHRF